MAKTSTSQAVIRSGPKGEVANVGNTGSVVLAIPITFNVAQASAASGVVIPAGCKLLGIQQDGGAVGAGATVDVGTSGTSDAYIAEGIVETAGYVPINGVSADVATTAPTEVYVGVGAVAGTGTLAGVLLYMRVDDDLGVNT